MLSGPRKSIMVVLCGLALMLASHAALAQQAKPIGFPDVANKQNKQGQCKIFAD